MNHPSEWAKFYDERNWGYRYRHKGSGVIRDTLMSIGKKLFGSTKKAAQEAMKKTAQEVGQKAATAVAKRGAAKIQEILGNRRPPATAVAKRGAAKIPSPPTNKTYTRKPPSKDAMFKLIQMLAKH